MQLNKKGNNPVLAAGFLFQGLKLLAGDKLRHFVLIPLLVNVLLYSVALTLGYFYVGDFIDQSIPGWLHWLRWILWPLFFILFFAIGFFSFTVLANIICAPFYGILAAKTMAILTGEAETAEQPLGKVMAAELRRVLYVGLRALPLLLLFVIPVVNLLAPVLWGLFLAWCLALEYFAYPLENAGVLFDEQKELVKSVRFGALSFGGLAMLGAAIPLLNIVVPPAAVVGATIFLNEVKEAEAVPEVEAENG